VPDNASAEETNSRLLRRRSLLFSGTANSFLLVLAGLKPVETMFRLFFVGVMQNQSPKA
jgi:hypothetical protein